MLLTAGPLRSVWRWSAGRVKSLLLWAAVLGLAVLFVRALLLGSPIDPAAPGEVAPEISVRDLSGAPVSLSSLRGRPVLVNFWATWCPPCRAELPELQALSQEAPRCLAVLGVAIDSGPAAQVAAFVRERGLTYPIAVDEGPAGLAYKIFALPHSVLVGPRGEVIGRFRGKVTAAGVKAALVAAGVASRCP